MDISDSMAREVQAALQDIFRIRAALNDFADKLDPELATELRGILGLGPDGEAPS